MKQFKVELVYCGLKTTLDLRRVVAISHPKGGKFLIYFALWAYALFAIVYGVRTIWETLEKNQVPAEWLLDSPFHVNHHVTKMYADEIFSVIFGEENSVGESGGEYVPFHFDFVKTIA